MNDRVKSIGIGAGAVLFVVVMAQVILPAGSEDTTPAAIYFEAVVFGLLNALLAAGIILIYRSSRILNFAQGAIGALGGTFTFYLVQLNRWPYIVAFVFGIVVAGLTGLTIELLIIRRFFFSPRLALTVLTIALASVLASAQGIARGLPIFPQEVSLLEEAAPLPLPFPDFRFQIGDFPLDFGFGHVFAIGMSLVAFLALGYFFRFTRLGVAMRAASQNSERAELLGINVKSLSTLVWTLAGVLSGLGLILTSTVTRFSAAAGIAPGSLVPAFAAAVIARMRSVPVAIASAVGIGVLRQSVQWHFEEEVALLDVGLFLLILLGLFIQRKELYGRAGSEETSTWRATEEIRPTPTELSPVSGIRFWRWAALAVGGAFLLLFPWFASTGQTNFGGFIAVNAIVLLSLLVLTGWAGQVSLGQFGLVALGAVLGGAMTSEWGIPFFAALPLGGVAVAAFSVLIGIPALRIRGLFLAITTFAFAFAVQAALFNEKFFGWLLPDRVDRPTMFLFDFEDERSMYYLTLVALALMVGMVSALRRYRTGRAFIGVRENESHMRSFAIRVVRTRLAAFALSGFLCGFAGVLHAHHQRAVTATSFSAQESLDVFLIGVVGGITSIMGVFLGTAYLAVRQFGGGDLLGFFIGPLGQLFILYVAPGGLASILYSIRDSIYRIVAQRRQLIVPSLMADYNPAALARRLMPISSPEPASGLSERIKSSRYRSFSDMYFARGRKLAGEAEGATAIKREEAAAFGAAMTGLEGGDGARTRTETVGT